MASITGPKARWPGRALIRRLLDFFLLGLSAAVLIYLGMLVVRVSTGYSCTQSVPQYSVRVQVINGTGESGVASRTAPKLEALSDMELDIQVVEISRFDLRRVPRSFIIARQEDPAAARLLAERVGLDPGEIVYQPLEHNEQHVTVTMVLGEDAKTLLMGEYEVREN